MRYVMSLVLLFILVESISAQMKKVSTEVLIVGGTTGGIAAGMQSARSGANTWIIEQTTWLGGMITAAGVSCTDGNNDLPSGIWEEFRQALYKHYQTKNLFTGWVSETCFEPHVGDSIFKAMAANEKKLQVSYGWYFDKVLKKDNKVLGAQFINQKGERLEVSAIVTVDATDLGDVFADAGAGYDIGTEDSSQSGESIAPGKSKVIQDLTWAATLQEFSKGTDHTIAKPQDYDPLKYFCSTSEAPCNAKPYASNTQKVLDYGKLRVSKGAPIKYMLNWPAHGNDDYLDVVEMKPIEREKKYAQSKNQTLGFVYFLQTTLKQKHIGFAEDEMDKGMAFIPYNREGRRVKGVVRFNINHIQTPYNYTLYRTGISVGDYPVDHHHAQYPGKVPPIPFPQVPSFSIPLGALIPKNLEGLIVCEKGISVSNIANGTTRLQPVVLLTGQAAGVLAAKAVNKNGLHIQSINIREVQKDLLTAKCYLQPFVDITPKDPAWESVQIVGSMGMIKGIGKSVGWANKTFFYPDSLMEYNQLINAIKEIFSKTDFAKINHTRYINLDNILNIYQTINREKYAKNTIGEKLKNMQKNLLPFHLPKKDNQASLTRKETAIYLSYLFNLFDDFRVNLQGEYIVQK